MKCSKCFVENPAEAKFCHQCGNALADITTTAAAAPSSQLPPQYRTNRQAIPDVPEETLWEGGYAPQAMYGQWLGAGVITLVCLVLLIIWGPPNAGWWWTGYILGVLALWAAMALLFFYRRYTMKFKLTNLRFFHEYGLLTRTVERIEVISMDDISFRQGLVERMLNIGDITIISSDRTQPELKLRGIMNVREVSDKFDRARRLERQRRGVYVEAM
jgi:membrane protein YdbS with pleckstrin-like domain